MPTAIAQAPRAPSNRILPVLRQPKKAPIKPRISPKQGVLLEERAKAERAFARGIQERLGLADIRRELVSLSAVAKAKLDCPLAVTHPYFFERLPGGRVYLDHPRLRDYVDSALYRNNFRGEDIERIKNIRLRVAKFSHGLDVFFARHGKSAGVAEKRLRFKEFLKEYRALLKSFSRGVGDMRTANELSNEVFNAVIPTLRSYGWAPNQLFDKVAPLPF